MLSESFGRSVAHAGAIALALFVVTNAGAGSADAPEAVDAPGDSRVPGCFDLLRIWVETNATGAIALHAHVASCPDPPPIAETYWNIDFDTPRGSFFTYSYYDPVEGYVGFRGDLGAGGEVRKGSFEFHPGAPAEVVVPFPPDIESLTPGDSLELVRLKSGIFASDYVVWDEAEATRAFRLPLPVRENETSAPATAGEPESREEPEPPRAAPLPAAAWIGLAYLAAARARSR